MRAMPYHIFGEHAEDLRENGAGMTQTQIDLPEFFQQKIAEQYATDEAQLIMEGSVPARMVSLRANTLKADREEIAAQLDEAGIAFERLSWYEDAFLVPQARENQIWSLDTYKEGKLYLQSLSSMIPALVMEPKAGEDILDMCAAPGGKTTQMAALSGGSAHITACEMNGPRAEKLRYNLDRQGANGVSVMQEDARRLSEFFRFDKILIDAPCTGSGTLRAGDPKAHKRFTPALLAKVRKSQRALLAKGLELLKPGGTLVYSTCSIFSEENEKQVEAALQAASKTGSYQVKPIKLPGLSEIPQLPCPLDGAVTVMPTMRYEGFFVCKIARLG